MGDGGGGEWRKMCRIGVKGREMCADNGERDVMHAEAERCNGGKGWAQSTAYMKKKSIPSFML